MPISSAASSTPPMSKPLPTPLRVRFAPSPTSYLHVGGARTALHNWLSRESTAERSCSASRTPTRRAAPTRARGRSSRARVARPHLGRGGHIPGRESRATPGRRAATARLWHRLSLFLPAGSTSGAPRQRPAARRSATMAAAAGFHPRRPHAVWPRAPHRSSASASPRGRSPGTTRSTAASVSRATISTTSSSCEATGRRSTTWRSCTPPSTRASRS
jgi:hypothetical protein